MSGEVGDARKRLAEIAEVRSAAAEAWDEGYEAAYGDLLDRDPHRTKNPYEKDNNHA